MYQLSEELHQDLYDIFLSLWESHINQQRLINGSCPLPSINVEYRLNIKHLNELRMWLFQSRNHDRSETYTNIREFFGVYLIDLKSDRDQVILTDKIHFYDESYEEEKHET